MIRTRPSLLLIIFLFSFLKVITSQDLLIRESELSSMPSDTISANLLIRLGKYYCSRDFEKSLLYLQQSMLISSTENYREGIAKSLLYQGRAYYYKDEYEIALEYLERARLIFGELKHNTGLAEYYLAAGAIHQITGNHLSTLKDYQEALRHSQKASSDELESLSYLSLGNFHLERKEPKIALPYLKHALKMKQAQDDSTGLAIVLSSIGKVYQLEQSYDSALYYLQRGFEIRTSLAEVRGMASSAYTIAGVLIENERYREATGLLQGALQRFDELKDDTGICICLMRLAEANKMMGNYRLARENANQALGIARSIENPVLVVKACDRLASIMSANKRYEDAFGYLILRNHLQDSLDEANKVRIIKEMDVKFRTVSMKDEISLLKSRNEIQKKNLLLLSVSVAALLAILILILYLFKLKSDGLKQQKQLFEHEKTINEQRSELSMKEEQLLREQLESKNRDLASRALEMLRINETISDIIERLENYNSVENGDERTYEKIRGIITGLEAQLRDNSWNEFEKIFRNIHSAFFQKLLDICPELSPSEIKVAAFLKLNLSTKEIAAITYKSEAGIKSTRYRLRKKLGLQSDDNLVPFLMKL